MHSEFRYLPDSGQNSMLENAGLAIAVTAAKLETAPSGFDQVK